MKTTQSMNPFIPSKGGGVARSEVADR